MNPPKQGERLRVGDRRSGMLGGLKQSADAAIHIASIRTNQT